MSGVLGGEWLLLRMPDWAKHILMHRIAKRVKEKKTRAARDVMLNVVHSQNSRSCCK